MFLELLLLVAAIIFLIQYLHFGNKPAGTPPGSLGLPIIGCLPPSNYSFEEYVNRCRNKYGDTFWLKMGSRNVVFICEYNDIVAAFNNAAMQGRSKFFSWKMFNKGKEKGISLGEGVQWKNLRRFAIRRLRDGGMGKTSICSIILTEAEALAEDFKKIVGKAEPLPRSINVSILNIIWKLVSDHRYEIDDPEIHKINNCVDDLINQLQGSVFVLFDLLPLLETLTPEFVANYFGKKSFQNNVDVVLQLIMKSVENHKKTIDEDNPRDLIDSYLIELKKLTKDPESQSDVYSNFCERELLYLVFDLFTAGTETTASTIRWYILLMAKYPHVQKKVHEELDKVLSNDQPISLDDKENLPYYEATINETLRLKTIAPFGLFHRATEDTTVDGYLVPKDTLILANLQACHTNPKFWEKPNEFYPEHFLNEDNSFNNDKLGLISFSTGRRRCMGENLARMDLYFVLATLLRKFSFEAPEGEPLSLEQSPDQPYFAIPKPFNIIINERICQK